jgi:hypothetical protein
MTTYYKTTIMLSNKQKSVEKQAAVGKRENEWCRQACLEGRCNSHGRGSETRDWEEEQAWSVKALPGTTVERLSFSRRRSGDEKQIKRLNGNLLRHYRSLAAANNKHSGRSPANHWLQRNERLGYSKVPSPLLRSQRHPKYSGSWLISRPFDSAPPLNACNSTEKRTGPPDCAYRGPLLRQSNHHVDGVPHLAMKMGEK